MKRRDLIEHKIFKDYPINPMFKREMATMSAYLTFNWTDMRLVWDKDDYEGHFKVN